MPVSAQDPINTSIANGVTTVFPYSFLIFDEDDLVVEVDGVEVSSGFSVSGVGDENGGAVTFSVAPDADAVVVRSRDMALSRDTDYQESGAFEAATVNEDVDRTVMMSQQIAARALMAPRGDRAGGQMTLPSASERANKYLGFGEDGSPAVFDPADGALSSAASVNFIQTITGAESMTLQARGRLQVWLEDFGAVGDYDWLTGTGTDDTAAVQAAIDALGPLGGGIIRAGRGKKYLVSEITCNWSHIVIEGENPSFDYTNDGIDSPSTHANLKHSCALVVKAGVFGIHFRADEGAADTFGVGRQSGLRNIAVICDLDAEDAIEYGVVCSTGGGILDNVFIHGFQYGYTGFYHNMNLLRRVAAMGCTKIGFLIASAPGATRTVSAYQHPNLNTELQDNLSSSTIYFLEKIVARGNFIGVAILNAEGAKISGVIESNRGPGLILFKKTDQTFDGLEVDCYFENNFSAYTGSNAADFEIDGSIAYSATAPGAITALRTSLTEYLKGSTRGEWSNAGSDIGPQIWIGSETESSVVQHVGNSKHPYGIVIKGTLHAHDGNQRLLKVRSAENLKVLDVITSQGHVSEAILLDAAFSLYTQLHNLTFDGTGTTFETNVLEAGLLGGLATLVTRPSLDTAKGGGIVVLQGQGAVEDLVDTTFTPVGCTTAPNITVRIARCGNQVTLYCPAVGPLTSNSISKYYGTLPTRFRPTLAQPFFCHTQDNGSALTFSRGNIGVDGRINLFFGGSNFTAAGTFSAEAFVVPYVLN